MAADWFECTVQRVGPAEDGKTYIWLRDETERKFDFWFSAHPAIAQPMLAVALTAITSGLMVSVFVTDTKEYSQIQRMYVVR